MLDFRMNTFLTVCRLLNYTRAAEELNITQPAVSQHIRYLEDYYGKRLFGYEGKRLRLTEAGKLLKSAATTMQHDESILREHMKTGEREKLIFGATRTIGDFVMPDKLASYIHSRPETDIRMIVDNTEHLLQGINEGRLEFAVIEGYFHKSEYDYKLYSSDCFIGVCSSSYRFKKEPKTLSDLFGERIIIREPGSGSREIFERHIRERNYSIQDFEQIIEIGSIHAIKSLVAAGCGITFLYQAAAASELKTGRLKQIPVGDFEAVHNFTMVWRKNSLYQKRYFEIFDELLCWRVSR